MILSKFVRGPFLEFPECYGNPGMSRFSTVAFSSEVSKRELTGFVHIDKSILSYLGYQCSLYCNVSVVDVVDGCGVIVII